jgi:ATP-dependent Clp protease ATP-binding subunit ClpC
MFERYTESARRALFCARYEVSQLGATSIEPDHIVLGLIQEGKGLVGRLLAHLQVSPESIRLDIERKHVRREKVSTSVEMPFTEDTKRALLFAAEESNLLKHSYIAPEHLLLGLVRAGAPALTSVIVAHRLRLDDIRNAIVQLAAGEAATASATPLEQAQLIDHIQGLVRQLGETLSAESKAREYVERISSDLDSLRRAIDG